jgi:hypothetical protein
MIPYPTEDYKKYIYALGMHRVRRLYDSVGGLDLDLDTRTNITCSLNQLEMWFNLAAFVEDDEAGTEGGCPGSRGT